MEHNKPLFGIFCEVFPPLMDGVSLTVKNYADWLHKSAENVCVVTPKVPPHKDDLPYNVHRYFSLPVPMRKPYRFGWPRVDTAFYRKINRLPFALLHTHSPFSSGKLAVHIARKQQVPLVATFHSKFRADFERAVPFKCKPVVDAMVRNVIRIFEQADEVWIPQASVEEPLREYGYKGKVEIVENGNDFADGAPVEPLRQSARQGLQVLDSEFMFLFVGQHIWEKNVDLIIRSLALLDDVPFKMYFIGSGYAEARMREMVNDAGLQDKIIFTGVIKDRERLKACYAAADLFLFPSPYDNAPLVVREAAAMHTPAVLLENSTAAEIIVPNDNGFLAANTPDAFAACIRQITDHPQKLQAVGRRAAQTIARPWADIMGEVLDRYMQLIKR